MATVLKWQDSYPIHPPDGAITSRNSRTFTSLPPKTQRRLRRSIQRFIAIALKNPSAADDLLDNGDRARILGSRPDLFRLAQPRLARNCHENPQWREPLPVVPGEKGRRIPAPVVSVLRNRIDALRSELAALREDEAALTRAWHLALRPKQSM